MSGRLKFRKKVRKEVVFAVLGRLSHSVVWRDKLRIFHFFVFFSIFEFILGRGESPAPVERRIVFLSCVFMQLQT